MAPRGEGVPDDESRAPGDSSRPPASRGFVWLEGAVVDAAEARVPVFDRGFLYGDSVYEVLRTFAGRPHALDEHLERLEQSAHSIGIVPPPRPELAAAVTEAVVAATTTGALPDVYLRIVLTRGAGPMGLDPALADSPRLVVMALPLPTLDPALYRDGVAVVLVGGRRNAPGAVDPSVKSGNYLSSVLAVGEARRRGAYEAVMCDSFGHIAEGATSNLFVVRSARLLTPPSSVGILDGITRRYVLRMARAAEIPVEEAPLLPADLEAADEAFLTSSVRGLVPITRVGDSALGDGRPGPITARLMAAWARETERR